MANRARVNRGPISGRLETVPGIYMALNEAEQLAQQVGRQFTLSCSVIFTCERQDASGQALWENDFWPFMVPQLQMVTYYTLLETARKELSNGDTANSVS